MADNSTWSREQTSRVRDFYNVYTRGFSAEAFQRLFTRDTRDAYRYFSNTVDREALAVLPWWKRPIVFARGLFLALTMKMSPARRVLFAVALGAAAVGVVMMLEGFHVVWIPIDPLVLRFPLPAPEWPAGTAWLLLSIAGLAFLIVLEVFERLSLKNDLEIARDIQQAMLPRGLYSAGGLDAFGITRAANTVGGDFYDILPRPDGRVVIALGDVAGKGSPAALLMAILLAMLRTLLDEGLDAEPLINRLNVQISRHAPSSRFITLQFVNLDPATGEFVAVNAGHLPALIRRRNGDVRAPQRGRHRAGDVRQFPVHRRAREARDRRPARALQRRHHGGREPVRHALRRGGPHGPDARPRRQPGPRRDRRNRDQGRRAPRAGRALRRRFDGAPREKDGRSGLGTRDSGFVGRRAAYSERQDTSAASASS